MKFLFIGACILLFAASLVPVAMASELQENQVKADLYYEKGNFSKAYKAYLKLAKKGDHYSQDRISYLFANGKGKSADINQAYAWSALAAESGDEQMMSNSDSLLQRADNPAKAQSSADKLIKKYGKKALELKAYKLAMRKEERKSGSCTGTHLQCRGG